MRETRGSECPKAILTWSFINNGACIYISDIGRERERERHRDTIINSAYENNWRREETEFRGMINTNGEWNVFPTAVAPCDLFTLIKDDPSARLPHLLTGGSLTLWKWPVRQLYFKIPYFTLHFSNRQWRNCTFAAITRATIQWILFVSSSLLIQNRNNFVSRLSYKL